MWKYFYLWLLRHFTFLHQEHVSTCERQPHDCYHRTKQSCVFCRQKILSVQICSWYFPPRKTWLHKFSDFLLIICPDDDTHPTASVKLTVGSYKSRSDWVLQCHMLVSALLTHITPLHFNTFFITCCWFIQKKSVQHTTSKQKTSGNTSGGKQALKKNDHTWTVLPLLLTNFYLPPFSHFFSTPVSRSRGWVTQTPAFCTARGGEDNGLRPEATLGLSCSGRPC